MRNGSDRDRQPDSGRAATAPAENERPPNVGENLKRLRRHVGLSLENLAKRSRVSRAMLGQIESGRSIPTVTVVWKIARALGVDTVDLISAPSQRMHAVVTAAQMVGALERVLELSVAFANQREQFGRPIGKFQAVQHQLAVMAEQVAAARMAAQIGCQGEALLPDTLHAAVANMAPAILSRNALICSSVLPETATSLAIMTWAMESLLFSA